MTSAIAAAAPTRRLDEAQVAAFRGFGFVVIRGCLSRAELAAVGATAERTLATVAGAGGTRLVMHPEDGEPDLAGLAVHPGILGAMRQIWGRPCLYLGSFLWANPADTPWHTAGTPGDLVQTLRVTVNLDATTPEDGALRVMPGTHFPQWNRGLYQIFGEQAEGGGHRLRLPGPEVPGAVAVPTRPGDVILWWNRLWHGAWSRRDGRPRRAVFLTYVPDPLDDADLVNRLRRDVAAIVPAPRPALYAESLLARPEPEVGWMAGRLEALDAGPVRPPAAG